MLRQLAWRPHVAEIGNGSAQETGTCSSRAAHDLYLGAPPLGQLDTVPERVAAEEARPADDLVGGVRRDAGVFEPASQLLEPGVDAQAEVLGQRCGLVGVEEMEFEVAADAEPGQLFRVELGRDRTLVEAEQLA